MTTPGERAFAVESKVFLAGVVSDGGNPLAAAVGVGRGVLSACPISRVFGDALMRLALRHAFVVVGVAAISLTAAAWGIGELLHLQPCPLCIFQRLLYLLLAALAFFAAFVPVARRLFCGLLVLTAAGGVTTASYQSWLQWQPDASLECGFGEPNLIERIVYWFGDLWPQMFMATGFCSSKEWVFLHLSMANWSALCFFAFLLAAAWLARGAARN